MSLLIFTLRPSICLSFPSFCCFHVSFALRVILLASFEKHNYITTIPTHNPLLMNDSYKLLFLVLLSCFDLSYVCWTDEQYFLIVLLYHRFTLSSIPWNCSLAFYSFAMLIAYFHPRTLSCCTALSLAL